MVKKSQLQRLTHKNEQKQKKIMTNMEKRSAN